MILIPFLLLFLLNLLAVIITKKKFGTVMPLSIILSCFALFFSQLLFQTFWVAIWLIALSATGAVTFTVYAALRKKELFKSIIGNYFTAGFFAFSIVSAISLILLYKTGFTAWDDYSHWGPMLKEMLRLDKFYSVSEAAVPYHKDYPPMAGLFELFFVRFTGYREGVAMLASRIMQLSIILPAIELLKDKSKVKNAASATALFAILFLTILFIDQHHIISSIYVDYVMALFAALAIYLAIFTKLDKFNIFYIFSIIAFLSLIKEITFVFASIVALVILSRKIAENGWKKVYKHLVLPIIICVIAVAGFGTWKFVVRDTETDRQFDMSHLTPSSVACVFVRKCPEQWKNDTTAKYIEALFTTNISNSYIKLSYVQELSLIAILFIFLYSKTKKNQQNKRNFFLLSFGYFIGAIVYATAMLVIYTCLFDEYEGGRLASFDRYLSTYTLIGFTLVIFYLIHSHIENDKTYNFFLICCILLVVQTPIELNKLTPQHAEYPEMSYCNAINDIAKEDQQVAIIYHDVTKWNHVRYCAVPYINNLVAIPFGNTEKVAEAMRKYDHFILIDSTEEELKEYSENKGQNIRNGIVY